jgi:4-amino-4-deoxy-L-arabinose transferase-like glycosyltransferase
MFHAHSWRPPSGDGSSAQHPPLVYWVTLASYKMLGVTATAARLPVALVTVLTVALTFLIGERLGGYWRGFMAGLIQLCWLGSFIWGRILTAEAFFAACMAGAIFCAIRGYQGARDRRLWFAGVWACVALGCLTKGAYGVIYPAVIFAALAVMFREARLRFRVLLDWRYLCGFAFVVTPLYFWTPWDLIPPLEHDSAASGGVPLAVFVLRSVAWWFPAAVLVVPGLLFATRKIFRPHEFEFADALPLCWAAVGFLPLLLVPARHDYHSMSMWSAVALCSAWAWQRMPRTLRLAGIGAAAAAGVAVALSGAFGFVDQWLLPAGLHASALGALPLLVGIGIVVACALAAYFAWHQREELALVTMMLATVPIGLSAAETIARFSSQFSFEDAATFLRPRLGDRGEVVFEGSAAESSSLRFYLSRPPILIDEQAAGSTDAALAAMAAPHPVYLIVHKTRIPYWQRRLTERFHIYHQATTCGAHVVINNHP